MTLSPQSIIRASAAVHCMPVADVVGPSRERKYSPARQTAAYLMDDEGYNFTQIARALNRAHNTAASALIDSIEVGMTPERQAQVDVARMAAVIFETEARNEAKET